MAKRRVELIEVKNPVATVQLNKHCSTRIYMVDAGEGFRLPDEGGKEQWACGPTVVLEHVKGINREYDCYCIGDSQPWQWLGNLLQAGQWALTDKNVAPLLPPELVVASPRFNGTSRVQRERMRDTLPEGARRKAKRKAKPKPKKRTTK